MPVTPEEYEHHVAEILREEGWEARVTPHRRDHGVDIVAERGGVRLAVQVKMFGDSNRPVAGKAVMELYGAAAYADCPTAVIATNGRVLPDAEAVAEKLGIEIRIIGGSAPASSTKRSSVTAPATDGTATFGAIWRDHVVPLAGTMLTRANGTANEILRVDDGGLERRSSNGRTQRIEIEIFRWAIERLLRGETVTRDEINAEYPGRASSGIVLVLSQVPLFEVIAVGRKQALRKRRAPGA
jgi:hypothetical protein